MIDVDPEVVEPVPSITAALKELLLNHARELRADFLPDLASKGQVPVAKLEVDGYLYALIRFPSQGPNALTAQQTQIALLVAQGLPNKAVARRLGIKPSTVASHLVRIYRKLQISSRAALARYSVILS